MVIQYIFSYKILCKESKSCLLNVNIYYYTTPIIEISDMLTLLRFRPKALRFQKQLLLTIHVRFQTRIKQLIILNKENKCNPDEILTIQQIKNQIEGLFYLKRNTSILYQVLQFAYKLVYKDKIQKMNKNSDNQKNYKYLSNQTKTKYQQKFEQIIYIINENLDDTIDPIRQSIISFIYQNYKQKKLIFNSEIVRMIVKCKFYKNFPLVRNQYWIHQYIYKYLYSLTKDTSNPNVQQLVSVLKSSIMYVMHIDPWSKSKFFNLIKQSYQIAKQKLLNISYLNNKQQLFMDVNCMSLQIKLIPSYIFIKNEYQINTINHTINNKVNSQYIHQVIEQIKPIIKKFILCYFDKQEQINEYGLIKYNLTKKIDENIKILNDIVQAHQDPQKLLLKSVQNLLNAITVFKDYNLVQIDVDFILLLVQTQLIYCVLCRLWITDQVRFLRLLQHSVSVIGQLQKQIILNPQRYKKYQPKLLQIKRKMQQQLSIYDNVEKTYKQFTILRLVSILKSLNVQPKFLGDFYKNIKIKKPNIYVQTLSRTMLRSNNYQEIIESFKMMFQGIIPVKQIQLGRIVFLSSKQAKLLKYWLNTNRQQFIKKICFNRKIITNIVSIIRMDNLQINRNSIQILSQIVIENKLHQLQNNLNQKQNQQYNQLKRIMCNNFSILFRYSKMDSMIDDIFMVNKNVPTLFKNKFSHIQSIKILSFAEYLSEQQSIFYINRQNKNALFKFVIMLMKKVPYCQKTKNHYLLKNGFYEQNIILQVVAKIIQQYCPDNKLTNKAMPFYSQFLGYYTKINRFKLLIKNENAIYLIIKQIYQDYKQVINNQQYKYIISRIQNNYQRLNYLLIFQKQLKKRNILQHIIDSITNTNDIKMFQNFSKIIQENIKKQIKQENKKLAQTHLIIKQQNKQNIFNFKNYGLNKHLINKCIIQQLKFIQELSQYPQQQILSLLTLQIFAHGNKQTIINNMKIILKKVLSINPLKIKSNQNIIDNQQYPIELFKIIISNINIYLDNQKQQINNNDNQILNEQLKDWIIKGILQYCKKFKNNQKILQFIHILNNWNVDVLKLIENKQLNTYQNLSNLSLAYNDVQILSILFSQNINQFYKNCMKINNNKQQSVILSQYNTQSLLKYIKSLTTQLDQTHLMNNYGIYFQQQGQKILNIMKILVINFMENNSNNQQIYKQATQVYEILNELFNKFTKLMIKTYKHNKMINQLKSMNNNHNQNNSHNNHNNHNNHRHNNNNNNNKYSKNYFNNSHPNQNHGIQPNKSKLFSNFTHMLDLMTMIKHKRLSFKQFNETHYQIMNKINTQINKNQQNLVNKLIKISNSTQSIENQMKKIGIQMIQFKKLGLNFYLKKDQKKNETIVFYLVDPKKSMLYDYQNKVRNRLIGQEQLVINYLETIFNLQSQQQAKNNVKVVYLSINSSKEYINSIIERKN